MLEFIKSKKFDIIYYLIIIVIIIVVFSFNSIKNKRAEQDFANQKIVETYTDESKYFYDIDDIYFFDKHIFCINGSENSVTILKENGECEKEIKFPDNEGHSSFSMFLKENELYIVDDTMQILLKHSSWDSYEKILLTEKEVDMYIDLCSDERIKTAYVDDDTYYKINNSGIKLLKVEDGVETIVKKSDTIDALKSFSVQFRLILAFLIFEMVLNIIIKLKK